MKGLILAGGSGTRLHPNTFVISKHLLPVYDKPMIYYPLSTLMLAGIQDILIITTPHDMEMYKKLLGSGDQWGINLSYAIQPNPGGLAQAFIIGKEFIGNDSSVLILGDNIFYGHGLTDLLKEAVGRYATRSDCATVFAYWVKDPERYGVITFDEKDNPLKLVEKPENPDSNWAVTGLYFYDNRVCDIVKEIKPSARGELEITSVNEIYLEQNKLFVEKMGRGYAWLDTGTHQSLLNASEYIHMIEERQGLKVCCPEEIAFQMGYINEDKILQSSKKYKNSEYGNYLLKLIKSN